MPHPLTISLVSHRMHLSPVLMRAWPLVWKCGPVSVAPWDIPRLMRILEKSFALNILEGTSVVPSWNLPQGHRN